MTQLLSPKVTYIESDQSAFVSSVGANMAFALLESLKGKVNDPTFTAERNTYIETFGEPRLARPSVLAGLALLGGTPIWGTRVIGSGAVFASSIVQPLSSVTTLASGTEVTPAAGNDPATYSDAQLSVMAAMNDGSTLDVTDDADIVYASSNPLIATVDAVGAVTGVATGSVTITATYKGAVSSIPLSIEIV